MPHHTYEFRVRYRETDQMHTFYNACALEWFEVGRTELSRALGLPYVEWERRGIMLPLVEAHVFFKGRAQYDDLLSMTTSVRLEGRARLRFDNVVVHPADGRPVLEGYSVHAMINLERRPVRAPDWVLDLLADK